MSQSEPILQIANISKVFAGVQALDRVSFAVRRGSVHVLCGENGAGKSTLMKIIHGIYQPDGGEILLRGQPLSPRSPLDAQKAGIVMISQELNYIPEMTIEEYLFLGEWITNKLGKVKWSEIRKATTELLRTEGLQYLPKMKMKTLSIADIQILEILKAVSCNADIIIMDEPTSAITNDEVEMLLQKIHKLREQGVGIIYISHKMDEIFRIADDISILRDGKIIETRKKEDFTIQEVIAMMVGRELSAGFPKEILPENNQVSLEIKDLSNNKIFKNISFYTKHSEIVGFAGLMGAGRTEVMRAIVGLDKYASGQIVKDGEEVRDINLAKSIANGMAMLTEDRRRYGIIPERSIRENVTLASLKDFFYGGRFHKQKELACVKKICRQMSLDTGDYEKTINKLSGGNQQKVILAKWMLHDPDILIMDEPTRGIDIGAKYEIYRLMMDFVKLGKTIIFISSELPELIGMSDRIYVMAGGKITGELHRQDFSQEKIMRYAVNSA